MSSIEDIDTGRLSTYVDTVSWWTLNIQCRPIGGSLQWTVLKEDEKTMNKDHNKDLLIRS